MLPAHVQGIAHVAVLCEAFDAAADERGEIAAAMGEHAGTKLAGRLAALLRRATRREWWLHRSTGGEGDGGDSDCDAIDDNDSDCDRGGRGSDGGEVDGAGEHSGLAQSDAGQFRLLPGRCSECVTLLKVAGDLALQREAPFGPPATPIEQVGMPPPETPDPEAIAHDATSVAPNAEIDVLAALLEALAKMAQWQPPSMPPARMGSSVSAQRGHRGGGSGGGCSDGSSGGGCSDGGAHGGDSGGGSGGGGDGGGCDGGGKPGPADGRGAAHSAHGQSLKGSARRQAVATGSMEREGVRLIAFMSHRCPAVQARVRELDGLITVLQRCQLDEGNPQIREWAVLALRNLTEGCPENQAFLAQIEQTPRDVVNADELEEAGLQVAVDKQTGKLRVAQNPV